MKYLFIILIVQDGENRHDHKILHTTKCKDINFAAQWYASHLYGYGELTQHGKDWWEFYAGCIAVQMYTVRELSEYEYNLMSDIFDGRTKNENYFEIVRTGHCGASNREEIQIHAGENGNIVLYQDSHKFCFMIDVYGQNDIAYSMTVWEEDLNPEEGQK